MLVDWSHVTPWASSCVGVPIGLAGASLALLNGRMAGISAILAGQLTPAHGDIDWRAAFLPGVRLAPTAYRTASSSPSLSIDAGVPAHVAAGLMVGVGTPYGSGCTSGHGVFGLSRLSVRSLVAAISVMGAGFATVLVLRHVLS